MRPSKGSCFFESTDRHTSDARSVQSPTSIDAAHARTRSIGVRFAWSSRGLPIGVHESSEVIGLVTLHG